MEKHHKESKDKLWNKESLYNKYWRQRTKNHYIYVTFQEEHEQVNCRGKRTGNLNPHITKGKSRTLNQQMAISLIEITVRGNPPPTAVKKTSSNNFQVRSRPEAFGWLRVLKVSHHEWLGKASCRCEGWREVPVIVSSFCVRKLFTHGPQTHCKGIL